MRKLVFVALSVASLGLALSGCAGRYYDDRYGYNDGGYYGHSYYDRYDRGYADRDGVPNSYDRDRDNDGVPNYADRTRDNPYRN